MKENISVKNNYIYNVLSQILLLIVPLLTTPYISRVLGAEKIGIYSYCLSIANFFNIFGCLGMATYGQLCIARNRDDFEEVNSLFWGIFAAKIVTMCVSIFAYLLMAIYIKQYQTMYWILITNLVATSLDITWVLQGLEQFKKIAVRNIIIKIISFICIFVFVKDSNDLYTYAAILQGSILIGNLTLWPYLKDFIRKPKIATFHILMHWKASLIYFVLTIATSVYSILDKSMLGWITHSAFENGYYEQAYKIEQVALTFITSLNAVFLPRMAYYFETKQVDKMREGIQKSLRFVLCISILMMFVLMGISKNLIPWYLGEGYDKCIPLLSLFSILLVVIGISSTIGSQCLISTGMQKQFNLGAYVAAVVNIIINLLLIQRFASIGTVIASVCAESCALFVFLHYSKNVVRIRDILRMSYKNLISGCIMGLAMFISCNYLNVSIWSIAVQMIAAVILYFLILIVMRDNFVNDTLNNFLKSL